jgi:glycosyltransferase involved in cell wall biosynthesis
VRALWLTAIPPSPDGGGGHIRQAHLLTALAERFDVHLVVAGRCDSQAVRDVASSVTEVPIEPDAPSTSLWRRRARDVRDLFVLRQHNEVAAHAAVRRALVPVLERLQPADLVQVEFIGLAPLVRRRRAGHWAVTLHNLGSGMARQRQAVAPGRRQRALHARNAANAERAERRALAAFDTTIVCSADDAAIVGGAPLIVPNGVDLERFRPSALPAAPEVVFLGALNTDPNVDGVRWLIDEIWPLVLAGRPDAHLSVVGMAPVPEVRALCTARGVTLHADVESTAPFLGAARVAVVPLRVGTGTRLKALEAMAAGRPVVGTSIGLGGLATTAGVDALVADDPASFAAAVLRLLDHSVVAERLATTGRAFVEANFGWERVGRAYAEELASRARNTTSRS